MNEYEQLEQGKLPIVMSTRYIIILFQRKCGDRIAADYTATILKAAGIMVALVQIEEEKIKVEKLQNLDYILVPETQFHHNILEDIDATKVYYQNNNPLNALLKVLSNQIEIKEIRKIEEIVKECELISFLNSENLKLIHEGEHFNEGEWKNYLLEKVVPQLEKAIDKVKEYNFFTTMHLGFFKIYLEYVYNNICDELLWIKKYFKTDVGNMAKWTLNNEKAKEYPSLFLLSVLICNNDFRTKMYTEIMIKIFYKIVKLNQYIQAETFWELAKNNISNEYYILAQKIYPKNLKYVFYCSKLFIYGHEVLLLDKFVHSNIEILENLDNFTELEIKYFSEINELVLKEYSRNLARQQEQYKKYYITYTTIIEKLCEYYFQNESDLKKKWAIMKSMHSNEGDWLEIMKEVKGNKNPLKDCQHLSKLECDNQVEEIVKSTFLEKGHLSSSDLEILENVPNAKYLPEVIFSKEYTQATFEEAKQVAEFLGLVILPLELSTCKVEEFYAKEQLNLHTFVMTSISNYNYWEEITNEHCSISNSQKWFPSKYTDIKLTLDLITATQRNLYVLIKKNTKKIQYLEKAFNDNMEIIKKSLGELDNNQEMLSKKVGIIFKKLLEDKYREIYEEIVVPFHRGYYMYKEHGEDGNARYSRELLEDIEQFLFDYNQKEATNIYKLYDISLKDAVIQGFGERRIPYNRSMLESVTNTIRAVAYNLTKIKYGMSFDRQYKSAIRYVENIKAEYNSYQLAKISELKLALVECEKKAKKISKVAEKVLSDSAIVFYSHDTAMNNHSFIFFKEDK